MSKSILCAVDVSNGDIDSPVLKRAGQLADLDGAQLDVVTVVPDFGDSWVSSFFEPGHHEKAVEDAGAHLRALCETVLGAARNASVRHVVATGKAYEQIIATAENAGFRWRQYHTAIGTHLPAGVQCGIYCPRGSDRIGRSAQKPAVHAGATPRYRCRYDAKPDS